MKDSIVFGLPSRGEGEDRQLISRGFSRFLSATSPTEIGIEYGPDMIPLEVINHLGVKHRIPPQRSVIDLGDLEMGDSSFSPEMRDSYLHIFNEGRTATRFLSRSRRVLVPGIIKGRKFVEFYFHNDCPISSAFFVGITSNATQFMDVNWDEDINSIGYYGVDGTLRERGVASDGGETFGRGDWVGVFCDADLGTIEFTKNGVSQAVIEGVELGNSSFRFVLGSYNSGSAGSITLGNDNESGYVYPDTHSRQVHPKTIYIYSRGSDIHCSDEYPIYLPERIGQNRQPYNKLDSLTYFNPLGVNENYIPAMPAAIRNGFHVTRSSIYSGTYREWFAFNHSTSSNCWISTQYAYNNSGYGNQYLQIEFPSPVSLDGFSITSRNVSGVSASIRDGVAECLNTSGEWEVVHTFSNEPSWGQNQTRVYKIFSTEKFKALRVTATRVYIISSTARYWAIGEMRVFRSRPGGIGYTYFALSQKGLNKYGVEDPRVYLGYVEFNGETITSVVPYAVQGTAVGAIDFTSGNTPVEITHNLGFPAWWYTVSLSLPHNSRYSSVFYGNDKSVFVSSHVAGLGSYLIQRLPFEVNTPISYLSLIEIIENLDSGITYLRGLGNGSGGLVQPTLRAEVIDYEEDVSFSSNIELGNTIPDDQYLIVRVKGNLEIEPGVTVQPKTRKLGIVFYVEGSFINHGTIDCTAKGANHGSLGSNIPAQDILVCPNSSVAAARILPAIGSADSVTTAASGENIAGTTGGASTNRGTGGGGGGSVSNGVSIGRSGTCFSGGAGGGGCQDGVSEAEPNGGRGGLGYPQGYPHSGGTGNPGGIGVPPGSDGTAGVLLIFVNGNFVNSESGIIRSNGSDAIGADWRAGGASGGGCIRCYSLTSVTNNGTIEVNGGLPAGGDFPDGGSGGLGSIYTETIANSFFSGGRILQ